MAIALVLGLTYINYLSVRAGSALQLVSTIIKILVVALLVIGIFYSGNGTTANFIQPSSTSKQGWPLMSGLIAALTGAFMSYDGWINITFLGGEIRQPQKNMLRSLVTGVSVCMVVYLLVVAHNSDRQGLYHLRMFRIQTHQFLLIC